MIKESMQQRLEQVRARIREACERVGRDPAEISLLPVSKMFPIEAIEAAVALGLNRFGENRPQDLAAKAPLLENRAVQWVMIGQVQTNKAKEVAHWADELQSLDRLALAQALQRRLEPLGRTLDVLVQVKTSHETSKTGVLPQDLLGFLRDLSQFPNLRLQGLMTVAVLSDQAEEVRACFRQLRQCRDQALEAGFAPERLQRLSMGMSGDLELAIEEGSTEVRVGTALFGQR